MHFQKMATTSQFVTISCHDLLNKSSWKRLLIKSGNPEWEQCVTTQMTHFEEREVNLFSVRILLFMDTRVQVLHIQYNPKQSVHLLLRHILQVRHMVTWAVIQTNEIKTLFEG